MADNRRAPLIFKCLQWRRTLLLTIITKLFLKFSRRIDFELHIEYDYYICYPLSHTRHTDRFKSYSKKYGYRKCKFLVKLSWIEVRYFHQQFLPFVIFPGTPANQCDHLSVRQ